MDSYRWYYYYSPAVVNFMNTFESNDPWKSWGGFIGLIVVILIFMIPISNHAVAQP